MITLNKNIVERINKSQANWIADLLESGQTHYELNEGTFRNAFYRNGIFVEERENRQDENYQIQEYSREEFVNWVISSPRHRFSRFLDMVN